jgi:hypothetical protein
MHFHTLIVGAVFGALYGAAMFKIRPLRKLCEKSMDWFGLPYRPILSKMILAGILGVWFHIAVDFYHEDVQFFWPFRMDNPAWSFAVGPYLEHIRELRSWVVAFCILCWAGLVVYYGWLIDVFHFRKQRMENARKARTQTTSEQATKPA